MRTLVRRKFAPGPLLLGSKYKGRDGVASAHLIIVNLFVDKQQQFLHIYAPDEEESVVLVVSRIL